MGNDITVLGLTIRIQVLRRGTKSDLDIKTSLDMALGPLSALAIKTWAFGTLSRT